MDQFLSRILDKYGLLRIVVAVLLGFVVLWALAHFTAAPGGNVSVLWGLVQYTKDKAATDKSTSITQQQRYEQKQDIKEPSSTTLPAASENVAVVQGVTKENIDSILQGLRAKRQLRALDTLESGRTVAETARGTYFYVSSVYMSFSEGNMAANLSKINVGRFRSRSDYFEIHYLQNSSPTVVGFTSESDAARLASPAHGTKKISLAALPWEKMPSLVSVPADKISWAKYRDVALSEGNSIIILDAEIR